MNNHSGFSCIFYHNVKSFYMLKKNKDKISKKSATSTHEYLGNWQTVFLIHFFTLRIKLTLNLNLLLEIICNQRNLFFLFCLYVPIDWPNSIP